MPKVTSITPQKRGGQKSARVNVFLDGEFAFGIDLDNLVKFGIKIEKEFTKEQVEKIIHEAEFAKTYNLLLNFATIRPRSEQEITSWLKRKQTPPGLSSRLIKKLAKLELYGDEKFAKWWLEQRLHFKLKSKKELVFELRQKGVNKKIIEDVLASTEVDELASVKKLVEKNLYKWDRYKGRQRKEKIMRYLMSKGFSFDVIEYVIKYFAEENENVQKN